MKLKIFKSMLQKCFGNAQLYEALFEKKSKIEIKI